MEFAFFVVNFGFSKSEFLALTETEKAFIYKAHENKTVRETNLLRDTIFNAVINAHRKKGKPFRKLWRKRAQKADHAVVADNINTVKEIEKNESERGWIEKIYKANGLKMPDKKKKKQKGAINNG